MVVGSVANLYENIETILRVELLCSLYFTTNAKTLHIVVT